MRFLNLDPPPLPSVWFRFSFNRFPIIHTAKLVYITEVVICIVICICSGIGIDIANAIAIDICPTPENIDKLKFLRF